MKCPAGVWVDSKQLLEHTRRLVGAFNDFDREVFGKDLVRLNVAMVRDFALAYRLRDEHYVYDDSKVVRDIRINGNKREYLDRFIGDLHIAREVLDNSKRNGIGRDYDNYKLTLSQI